MTPLERTEERIAEDIYTEREQLRTALEQLGNDVDDIMADLRRKTVDLGKKALMAGPALLTGVVAFSLVRRRRRRER